MANIPVCYDILPDEFSIHLLFVFFRLLRIVKFFAILRQWEIVSKINVGYLRISKFVVGTLILIHWIACFWFLVAIIENFSSDSWAVKAGIQESHSITQYIRSLYWAITTMTTVGYGDISPGNNSEYVFAMGVMLLGASMYAFIIGNIASVFAGKP